MDEWCLELSQDTEKAISKAVARHPHLGPLIEQRIQALLDFPPEQWFVLKFEGPSVLFMAEHGQKVRLSGEVILAARKVRIFHFSLHD